MKKKNLIRLQDISFGTIAVSSLFLLVGASGANAATSAVDEVTITVPASCSLTNTIGSPHTATIETGVYQDDIGETTFKVFCNDNEGFAVYAVGYTGDAFGNTTMKPSTLAVSNAIATGTATSGSTSNWAMKLMAVSGDYAPTLETGFNDYHVIPDTYTKVASYASNTDGSTGSSFKSTYGAFISQTQPADSYTGKVKYTVVHPANAATPITPAATMQNMSSSVCTTTPKQVIDNRDEHIYTVQRLADGTCWMMENLDLGRTPLTTDLTSANTNLSTPVTATTFNSWKKTLGTVTYDAGEFIPVDGIDSTSGTAYGTLYNYYVASAGTISGSSNSSNATYDICPAGWRLPTGHDTGEFQALYMQYRSDNLIRASIANGGAAFAFVGVFADSAPDGQGSFGNYWSSSVHDNTDMYRFSLGTGWAVPSNPTSRYFGVAIRCVLKETKISDLTYLQDFKNLSTDSKASVLASMIDNTTYNLIDNRDNRTYAIAKLKDGNIWMAENLDLGRNTISTSLTSANTNLVTTIAASTFNAWIKSSGTTSYTSAELISVMGGDSTSHAPYGTLYNYCAASAGTICSAAGANNDNATSDLCPAGWRLPTGGSSGEFQILYSLTDYNTNAKMRAPIDSGGAAFALAGYFDSSAPAYQGSYGFYWSSTIDDGSNMYELSLNTSSVYPTGYDIRLVGGAIRCVANL